MRQTGITTDQIQNAPQLSVFVWVNADLHYPRGIQRLVDRMDVLIVSPHWLSSDAWHGLRYSDIILDHALELNSKQWESLDRARCSCLRD